MLIDKKELIIKSAMCIFVKNGFHGTSTSAIAKECKIAKGTLFHHFSTKEDLVNEIYAYCKASLEKDYALNFENNMTIKSKAKLIFFNCLDWSNKNPEMHKYLKLYQITYYVSDSLIDSYNKTFSKFYETLILGQKQDILKDGDINIISRIIMSLVTNSMDIYINRNSDNISELKEYLFGFLWDSIKA